MKQQVFPDDVTTSRKQVTNPSTSSRTEASFKLPAEKQARIGTIVNGLTPATTHWRKLADRVNRGVGNPCPLLLLGLPASAVIEGAAEAPREPDLLG